MKTIRLFMTGLLLLMTSAVFAQNIKVSGTVTDASNGEPVAGASVLLQGASSVYAMTDVDGKYELSVPSDGVLSINFLGYKPVEVAVGGRSVVDIALATDTEMLEDVIVIGYGTAKKKDYIGSVSTIKGDEVIRTSPVSVETALQGMAAGVQVSNAAGVPGSPQQVKVRGISSISSGTDPLWIVDGIPVQSSTMDVSNDGETGQSILGMINPNDIQSIQVLKDAAATAIYGSRGSNGVIIITTKSGEKGDIKVNVDLKAGISGWENTNIGLANTKEWFQIADAAVNYYSHGTQTEFSVNDVFKNLDGITEPLTREEALAVDTDWGKEISRTGSFQEANVSLSSGAEKVNTYFSFKYRHDNGNIMYNDMETMGANVKLGYKPFKWLDFSYRLSGTYTDNNRVKSSDGKAGAGGWAQVNTNALPWFKVYSSNGLNGYWNSLSSCNPMASLDPVNTTSNLKTKNVMSALSATVWLPVKGLSLVGEWGLNYVNSHTQSYRSDAVRLDGALARENKNEVMINNLNAYLNYSRTFGDIHDITATLGVESTRKSGHFTTLQATGLNGSFHEIGTPAKLGGSSGLGGEEYLLGYFLRANYKLMNRYIINASARRDGISKFTAANRWANFFSGGLGWIISEEEWFDNSAMSLLKLRGSVGQTGNTNIPTGITSDQWQVVNVYNNTLEKFPTSRIYSMGNADIKWETTTSYDVGVDYGFLNNRINGSLAYYRQNVKNMLLAVSMPMSSGLGNGGNDNMNICWQNVGDMYNQGVEFEIFAGIFQKKNFTWNVGFNISYNRNKITALDADSDLAGTGILNAGEASQVRTIMKTGYSYGTYYMAEFAGVDSEKGIPMIYEVAVDKEGNTSHTGKIIPATSNNIGNNRMILDGKSALPKIVGGLNTSFKIFDFDLSAVFAFAGGNYLYSRMLQSTYSPNQGMLAMNKALLTDGWKQPGDKTDIPMITAGNYYYYDDNGEPTTTATEYGSENKTPISRFLYKGDYFKLRNLTIGYTLPGRVTQRAGMNSVRFYISANNLFTITEFPGYDPEVAIDQASGSAVEAFTAMPASRTFLIGLTLNL